MLFLKAIPLIFKATVNIFSGSGVSMRIPGARRASGWIMHSGPRSGGTSETEYESGGATRLVFSN